MASDSDVQVTSQVDSAERDFVRLLISLYRERPHLWNVSNAHYLDKNRRVHSLHRICEALKIYKPDYTVDLLKKKINILRTNFNKERNKIEARRSTEPALDADVKIPPNLWYYNELLFLAEQGKVSSTKTVSGDQSTSQSVTHKHISKKKRLVYETSQGSTYNSSSPVSAFQSQENEADLIAKCWALKLQRLVPDQRIYAEKIINDTLFEAEMGTLTRYGANFVTAPTNFVQCSAETHTPMFHCSPVSE